MFSESFIREKVKCCACGGSLKGSQQINLMCLMKEAEWEYPCWGNFLLRVHGFASAVLCDKCVKENKKVKFAVEWDKNHEIVKYHPVKDLVDVPKEIFDPLDELEPGRHGTAG